MGQTVDGQGAASAYSLSAIMIKNNRLDSLFKQLLIQLVQHFQEGGIFRNLIQLMGFEPTWVIGIFLPPNSEYKSHCISVICNYEPQVLHFRTAIPLDDGWGPYRRH